MDSPWTITERISDNEVRILDKFAKVAIPVHVERLKKYHANEWWTLDEYDNHLFNQRQYQFVKQMTLDIVHQQ